jgi:ssDNA-binding Zn-finger/Zn-ribbon topoisomerase 1
VAKKAYYESIILKSHNKIKATWPVIESETDHKTQKRGSEFLKCNNTVTKDGGQ